MAERLSQSTVTGRREGTFNNSSTFTSQTISADRWANALYSASAEDRATVGCFLLFQEIRESPSLTQKPVTERLVCEHAARTRCDFQTELEQRIGYCIDCSLLVILDRASEDLEFIRAERRKNREDLDSLLKEESVRVFQARGSDRPLVTSRRSRACIGIRATHKHLLPGGVILDASSSGATYFMEPKDAVQLNNMEVKLLNYEKEEEKNILRSFTDDISKAEKEILYLIDKVLEVDLACARAAYGRWMRGVCPTLNCEREKSLFVDIEGIRHPILLESSLPSLSDVSSFKGGSSVKSFENSNAMNSRKCSSETLNFPVPIDLKIGGGTTVVVISGPNTGGKTASMKTIGLASLMSKAGMYLSAGNQPKIPWFDLILADIGDHQSLEQSLSTFSGHMSRIRKILEVSTNDSLVLIDEIGSGTDPSEGVALSTSILQYLKDRVGLAVVTTHYADLSLLKNKDSQFENAAMEFSLDTLLPTYRILWGTVGNSNALTIASSIGFDKKVIERARQWVQQLDPDKQQERKGLLYLSLVEERQRLEMQSKTAASIYSEIIDLYREIRDEANDLDNRLAVIKSQETKKVRRELRAAKAQIEKVLEDFENQVMNASPDEYNLLIRKSESKIMAIVKALEPSDDYASKSTDDNTYIPKVGDQVYVKGLGDKVATIVEPPGDDETVLVQYGKIKVRVKTTNLRVFSSRELNASSSSVPMRNKRIKDLPSNSETKTEEKAFGPVIQTSKNTVDLRGMRVEEASQHLEMAILSTDSRSVLFIIHGMGTGALKERVYEMLKNNPRIAKFEQEDPMNYGCTVAYIK
uniref:Smr domain-containing protein n=1 Tax=Kalanchoe fedtschenkoi TaxID=63787 RepID=A0A7N0TK53_KALFE